jgi:hypothetical protein
MDYKHYIKQTAFIMRHQLSSEKRKFGCSFAAATSMAAGVSITFILIKKYLKPLLHHTIVIDGLRKANNSDYIERKSNKLTTIINR